MPDKHITAGTRAFQQLRVAMLAAGFSTFALLYGLQPLLPVFSLEFDIDATEASLAISVATGTMAFALLCAGVVADKIGRRPVMMMALLGASLLTVAAPFLPGWRGFLMARFLAGLFLAGIPASVMAFIGEEVEHNSTGRALGLYIAGSAIGGMSGRLFFGLASGWIGWKMAIVAGGCIALLLAILFCCLLPSANNFRPRHHTARSLGNDIKDVFKNRTLRLLFIEAFLLMGVFITIYNYAGFYLIAPPYSLKRTTVGAIFVLYILGCFSSAWAGSATGRHGARNLLSFPIFAFLIGLMLLLTMSLPTFVTGIAVITVGFFGAHSIASIWVAQCQPNLRAQAAVCYLTSLYLGASLLGSAGGLIWSYAAWPGVIMFSAFLLILALGVAYRLKAITKDSEQTEEPVSGQERCFSSMP